MTERELKDGFERLAAPVLPGPDPYGRMMLRKSRQRRARVAGWSTVFAAGIVAVLLGPIGLQTAAGPGIGGGPSSSSFDLADGGPMTPWVKRLIDSPRRGALAADPRFIEDVESLLAQRNFSVVPGGRVKVLFAQDVGQWRVVLAARYSTTHQVGIALVGAAGTPADGLMPVFPTADPGSATQYPYPASDGVEAVHYTVNNLAPYTGVDFIDHRLSDAGISVQLAPQGCIIAGQPMTGDEQWQDESTDGVVVQGRSVGTDWKRVTCDGVVRYRSWAADPLLRITVSKPLTESEVTQALVGARGDFTEAAARDAIRFGSPREAGMSAPKLLFGGSPAGELSGQVECFVSVTRLSNDEWELSSSAPNGGGFGLRTTADLGRSDLVLAVPLLRSDELASRVEESTSPQVATQTIEAGTLLLAPPEAVRVDVLDKNGTVIQSLPLENGVGSTSLLDGADNDRSTDDRRLRALDANGAVVATGTVQLPPTADIQLPDIQEIDNW